ncbi:MarR family transcriptional regulator, organic hydroperoxide resistance regulator [Cytobacillus horneckiae]|uniref:MarR family transcriptional regulator n=1 Tax=Cytobacillus horneckiae TaxID=549687 RepID=A0A2N0ZEY7_9BACI|nr:MarR family transcriptional regulator [Cytobacillus horneckiae]NRG44852.1 MarR family transcriptional regulator [Bacillus sp. CRN 9]MBN6889520.1 MarR family transcriptional regulator [Cytobacillus horneckiae]MCM3176795.1 MarR family transcriptional regulator [Cytobacillus horneckiae]MEC1156636.1 MarR family transcriptional regulator [Cytobacillus horneckiae]MED2939142.1 MarR family transcriptional regulator [Cytobacillus horneckiae]
MIEEEIRELLYKLTAQMRRNYADLLRELDLYVGQDQLLCQLWKEDGVTQLQLSEKLKCEPPTVTNMVKKLESRGILMRKRDENDRRMSRVYITDKGRALYEPVVNIWSNQTEALLQGFTPEQRVVLKEQMEKMYDNLS